MPESHLELFALVALRRQDDIVLQIQDSLVIALERLEIDDEIVLNSEDGVRLQPRVVTGVQLGGAALELRMRDHDVNVSGSHGMTVHETKQLVGRTIGGQRVGGRVVAVEPVLAVLVGSELATQVVGRLVLGVLEIVLAVGAGLPDVKDGVGDRLAGDQIADDTVHEADAAFGSRILDNGAAVVTEWCVRRPEGTQDGRRRGVDVAFSDDLVGNFINQPGRHVSCGSSFIREKG